MQGKDSYSMCGLVRSGWVWLGKVRFGSVRQGKESYSRNCGARQGKVMWGTVRQGLIFTAW